MKEYLTCTCPEERFCEECPAVGTTNNCLPWCSFLKEVHESNNSEAEKEKNIMKITTETLKFLRTLLPNGTKIVLDQMKNDPFPVPVGTIGVVDHIDDAGQIHCRWETGSGIAVIPGIDQFHVFTEKDK